MFDVNASKTLYSVLPSWIPAEKHKSIAFAVWLRVMRCDAFYALSLAVVSLPYLVPCEAVAAFCECNTSRS